MALRNLLLAAAVGAAAFAGVSLRAQPTTAPAGGTTLRAAAGPRLLIGGAVMSSQLDDPKLAALVAANLSTLTGENEFKPASLQPRRGEFDFGPADRIADFAQAHDVELVGHALLWHNQTGAWMFEDADKRPLRREVALANLKTHVDAVAGHFKGRVIGWDVVNEAIPDGEGDLRDTPALRAIGADYVEKAFEFARAADPGAELYYNDYNIEREPKLGKTIKLLRRLKAKGVRVDAVGIQGHWLIGSPSASDLEAAIKAYAAEGVKVHVTELDVDPLPRRQGGAGADITAVEREGLDPYKDGLPADVQQQLADRYAEIFQVFKEHEAHVTRVTLWGTHDGTSWLNDWPVRGRTNHPLLWDRDLKPKPAFDAVVKVLQN